MSMTDKEVIISYLVKYYPSLKLKHYIRHGGCFDIFTDKFVVAVSLRQLRSYCNSLVG